MHRERVNQPRLRRELCPERQEALPFRVLRALRERSERLELPEHLAHLEHQEHRPVVEPPQD